MNIARLIDHTLLRTDATISDIGQLCKDAIKHDFVSVCVNPVYVPFAVEYLQDHETKVGTTIGFPIGAVSPEMKYAETRFVIHQGAEEIDMVINVGALKDGNLDLAVSNRTSGGIAIFLGKGNGDFENSSSIYTGNDGIAITNGDFNGDGVLDLAMVSASSHSLLFYRGDGKGGFNPW